MLTRIGLMVNGAVIIAAGRLGCGLARRRRLPQYLRATIFFNLVCRPALAGRR